jgi:TolB-like protein
MRMYKKLAAALFLLGITLAVYADDGKGIRLAVVQLQVSGQELTEDELWYPEFIQGTLTNNFARFSAMEIVDRMHLEKVLAEQDLSELDNFSKDEYSRVGSLVNAQYILTGTLIKINGEKFRLQLAMIDTETGIRFKSYDQECSKAEIENTRALRLAVEDLLSQMGVDVRESGIQMSFAEQLKAYYRENGLFFIGLRAGLGMGSYTPGADLLPAGYSGGKTAINTTRIAFDFALQVSIAPVKFFALQTEAMLVSDGYKVEYTPPMRDREAVMEVSYTSLLTPLIGKFMFKPELGNLTLLLQGYGGIYFTIPLTPLDASGSAASFSKSFTVPLGFLGGGGVGVKLGPGFVFLDARYLIDSGDTEAAGRGKLNKRQRLSFSAGYEIKLF